MNRPMQLLWNGVRLPDCGSPTCARTHCWVHLRLRIGPRCPCIDLVRDFSAVGPRFPFVKALCISLSFGVILFLYYAALSLFIED